MTNATITIHIHVLSRHIFSFLLGEYPEVEFLLVLYGCMVMTLYLFKVMPCEVKSLSHV